MTTCARNYLDRCRAVEYGNVDSCPSGVSCQPIVPIDRHVCGFDLTGIGGVGCRPILSAGPHISKFDHLGTGKCGWRPIIVAPPAFRNSTSRKIGIYDCRNDSVLSRTGQKRL
jgi:hypothetical protein